MEKGARLGVLIGGPSSEYEVSKATAENIFSVSHALDLAVLPILVTREESWYVYASPTAYRNNHHHQAFSTREAVERLPQLIDAAFVAMHGSFGEDGSLQRLLDRAGLPYQGSGVRASRLAFDKHDSAQALKRAGFVVPDHTLLSRTQWVASRARILRQTGLAYGFPVVVKPCQSGSSVGVRVVRSMTELAEALELVSAEYGRVIIQKYLKGHEITCGVLEIDRQLIALPPTLIRPLSGWLYDYAAKYTPGAAEKITPAPFPKATLAAIERTAVGVHRALKLHGYSRVDMILSQSRLWVLEANTLPDMTSNSLFTQAAAAYGLDLTSLIKGLVEQALTRSEVVELS